MYVNAFPPPLAAAAAAEMHDVAGEKRKGVEERMVCLVAME